MRGPRLALATLLVIFVILASTPSAQETPSAPLVVFCVRHAEKAAGGRDPSLSEAGTRRAAALARLLRDAGIGAVHSTGYARTLQTAAPLAKQRGLTTRRYDPRAPRTLLATLRKEGGRHLVVGHSNTTPSLVTQLGGVAGTTIDEAEYDRLYVVTIGADGKTSTVLLRY